MNTYLDFEKPLADLDRKIAELENLSGNGEGPSLQDEISRLREKSSKQLHELYKNLDPWRKTQVARHPERPHFKNYIAEAFEDFVPLAGDRVFGEDEAIVGGLAKFRGRSVVVMGHEKGRSTEGRIKHNFGMAHPEGYRKAVRLMDMAEQFDLPVVTLVDTAGAYPGKAGEERGQAEAIARSTERCLTLPTPMVSVIVGEGGSGGAIGIAAANKVLILEHSIYSVISPEGCASILWRDAARARDAAEAMKITAQPLLSNKIVDEVISEPLGGAHRDPANTIRSVCDAIDRNLTSLEGLSPKELRQQRKERFYAIGRMN
ncbi:acetyl-CoA carboxylase carboxyltransferase subunit alpha [Ponticaulis sp.]|uniref:acetyl-CoA carboxylase carboxyltransferase subunit alpha n=1 Tax=Ponticaulis sp. TaxID=2020902 RepID=UPI000C4EEE6A|nr:acetyl-CoA carboxylase carboxyltransferase subunit alpha [Ponticaulis sp.]MAJ10682.1 acetyl-CoA carboxylase carboxyl transferase subunit alpha [Ponticaulis sp.]MDF1680391.1 acetyl-CoA carboxylase carboxyltransferase subunit alpha [Ponticaulis sp.]